MAETCQFSLAEHARIKWSANPQIRPANSCSFFNLQYLKVNRSTNENNAPERRRIRRIGRVRSGTSMGKILTNFTRFKNKSIDSYTAGGWCVCGWVCWYMCVVFFLLWNNRRDGSHCEQSRRRRTPTNYSQLYHPSFTSSSAAPKTTP